MFRICKVVFFFSSQLRALELVFLLLVLSTYALLAMSVFQAKVNGPMHPSHI